MSKEGFLRQFPKELEYEVSKIYNSIEMAKEYEIITFTEEFYTPNIWKKLNSKVEGMYVFTNGIFENSDRCQISFVPEKYLGELNRDDENNFIEFPSELLCISVNSKFKEYSHKDFLGSLMGLNIKRELMGDLILKGNIAYVPVAQKIYSIVENELKEIGKNVCVINKIDKRNLEELPQYQYEEKIITVNSKRIDSIVSSIINLSRNKIIEAIEKGKVLIDYVEERDKSKIIEIGSTITIRGYGKYKLFNEIGQSKKGKEKLIIKKYT